MTPLEEIASLADVPIDIEVELDRRTLRVRDILEWEVGSVVVMTRSAGENIDIHVGGRLVAYGEVVIIENTIGVRITDFQTEG